MLTYATLTNIGDRPVNEDSVGAFEKGDNHLFVLCDGLGGHGMGDVASKLVVEVFENHFNKTDDVVNFLSRTFSEAQQLLLSEQVERHARSKMKTTCSAAVIDGKAIYIGHIGDSRIYVFNNNKIKYRTLDHSIPQMLALTHQIKESDIRNHPDRNIVLRVMGIEWEKPMYELTNPIPMKKCQAVLLCSDGFWELIDEKEMCSSLKTSSSPDEWLNSMAVIVKKNGKGRNMDNFSAVAVWNN